MASAIRFTFDGRESRHRIRHFFILRIACCLHSFCWYLFRCPVRRTSRRWAHPSFKSESQLTDLVCADILGRKWVCWRCSITAHLLNRTPGYHLRDLDLLCRYCHANSCIGTPPFREYGHTKVLTCRLNTLAGCRTCICGSRSRSRFLLNSYVSI